MGGAGLQDISHYALRPEEDNVNGMGDSLAKVTKIFIRFMICQINRSERSMMRHLPQR
jgi:hypothetical protein